MGERFSASKFWEEIRKYKATSAPGIGGILHFLYAQPRREDDAENTLRFFFAGPIPREIWQDFEKRFKVKIYCGFFGMTEASGITWMSPKEQERLKKEGKFDQAASCGRENKDIFEVKLVDDHDNEVVVGEIGEIICRPARPFSMFSEYINMPEKTLEAFRNLYFHTGDLGKKDSGGYFYFVDRKKDYIRRRGENISSYEVEAVINSHPMVLNCAAIGVKSELEEDELKVVVELKRGKTLKPKELLDFCQERMAYYMVPRYIEYRKLPLTPTGRIEKYKLRSEGLTSSTWDRESIGYEVKR
jgi:crotonobetaine/carnitine-CoA ligase